MVHRLKRYGQIADVMVKYGFGIFLDQIDPDSTRRKKLFKKTVKDNRSIYERMRLGLEELGPTAVKFGQMAASRSEALPPELIEELKKLHDSVTPVPFEDLLPVIEEYCGKIDETFEFFERIPVAAASIGQVHRAILKDGTVVAIKIQRPDISETIEMDTIIIENMARRFEKVNPALKAYNLTGLVDDFSKMMKRELDYIAEGKNADIFRRNFKNKPDIKFPKIYWEYSGSKLLMMEYIEGVRADNVEGIKIYGYDPKKYADLGFETYLKMIFEDGFFHIDPHPGNIFVTIDGKLAFIDLGAIAVIRPERRHTFIKLLLSIVDTDVDMIVETFKKLGVRIDDDDLDDIKDNLYYALFDAEGFEISSVDAAGSLKSIPDVLNRYHIQIPGTLMSLLKVIMMVIGLGQTLNPKFNFYDKTRPYLSEVVKMQYFSPQSFKKTSHTLIESIDSIMKLPKIFNRTMNKWAAGKFQIDIVAKDVERLSYTIEKATDKLLMGLVASALVIGASIVMYSADFEYSGWLLYFTIAIYFTAFVIGLAAIIKILFVDSSDKKKY
ncbi:AarF/UbiB family protein [Methanomicrobium antiquum]|uniref:AarF/UbiB family protein n=1 Tax=Methanomicrobium antiquum TaxID=487686 RepID=A0AAF0JMK1_9EURY|nr:AarF/UbiB family protein [Methanomicrobium antiquum]WFN36625.1 AarF/UbiB family protein [Methanomicrobium antiquum]